MYLKFEGGCFQSVISMYLYISNNKKIFMIVLNVTYLVQLLVLHKMELLVHHKMELLVQWHLWVLSNHH